jgi:hypothetical protein
MFHTLLRDSFRAAPVGGMEVSPAALGSAEVSGIEALVRRRLDDAPSNVERFQALEQLRRERWLTEVFTALTAHGIPAVTFKGWALARLYGRPGLRPVGDVDLLVRREDLDHARGVLAGFDGGAEVDVQADLSRYLPDRSTDELLASSLPIELVGGTIRVLAPADHLRLVSLHQLHHGSWRPLWLCDVAVLVEALPPAFRWSDCLRGSRHLGEGVLALVELARRWLGARPSVEPPPSQPPEWFERAILRAWARGYRPTPERLEGLSLARLPGALRARWPDPLSSTLHLDAPFHGVPRFPIQVAELVRRGSRHAGRRLRSRGAETQKRGKS